MTDPAWTHTSSLRYSWLERRLHFWLFGHWPDRVVNRRLAALDLDEKESRSHD